MAILNLDHFTIQTHTVSEALTGIRAICYFILSETYRMFFKFDCTQDRFCNSISICIYIYIIKKSYCFSKREREREREIHVYTHTLT
jgi:hypothetical protein